MNFSEEIITRYGFAGPMTVDVNKMLEESTSKHFSLPILLS